MPKLPAPSTVDIEIRKRLEEGMLAQKGHDIRGDEEQYRALLRLCRLAGVDPLIHTYAEIDAKVQAMWTRYRDAAQSAELRNKTERPDRPNRETF